MDGMKSGRAILARRDLRRGAALGAWAATMAVVVSGCQSGSGRLAGPAAAPPHESGPASLSSAALVLPGEPLAAWERTGSAIPDYQRFEYGRNDARLNLVLREPLRAEETWLEPVPPFERPVRFRRWEQK